MKSHQENSAVKPILEHETDELYQLPLVQNLIAHWDELIDWEARSVSEGRFFIETLQERGAKNVLDVATGTGFHSVL